MEDIDEEFRERLNRTAQKYFSEIIFFFVEKSIY
jgi:hypothetical protein